MYEYIKGKVSALQEGYVILENNNIGYIINMSSTAISELSNFKDEVKILTYLYVREDDLRLYGFLSKLEKDLFLSLINVSSVGPKTAMQILSSIKYTDLLDYIITANIKELSKAKGIGKKTAQRIVIELKDKLSKDAKGIPFGQVLATEKITSDILDAKNGLMSLGYTGQEAEEAISRVKDNTKLKANTLMMLALKELDKGK